MTATELATRRGSALWRRAGDARLIATGAYAILLQVSHPTVGAGVTEHSDFRSDPWGRLLRTLDYSYAMTYGGPELATGLGRRIREMHRSIRGRKADGGPYHALEPEAFTWVHATLVDSIVRGHQLLVGPLRPGEIDDLYAQWRRSGELIGVRERDMPADWAAFGDYFERMVSERLERTRAVDEVLEAIGDPRRPPLPLLTEPAWRLARMPVTHQISLVTAGLLTPSLRDRFGIRWTRASRLQLRLLAAASRAVTPLLLPQVRNVGPTYLRLRSGAIARGDAASPERAPGAGDASAATVGAQPA
ncbi:MAG TPA: oxygenase MpaB family protein [Solirubrobacterales bacterium]